MRISKLFIAAGAMVVLATGMQASIIYNLNQGLSTVTGPGPTYTFVYDAVLSGDQQIVSGQNDFGVIYDFGGLISASSVSLVGGITTTTTTPLTNAQATLQGAPDSATIANVYTTITGTFSNLGTPTTIYRVTAISSNPTGSLNFQSGQANKLAPGDPSNGTLTGNTVQVEGPGTSAPKVPEPTTNMMLGGGLTALALLMRKLKK